MQRLLEKQMTSQANVQFAVRRKQDAESALAAALRDSELQRDFDHTIQTLRQQTALENAQADAQFQQAVVELESARATHLQEQVDKCLVRASIDGILHYANPRSGQRVIESG